MSFFRDKQTLRLIAILFGVFLFLFFSITYVSRHRFLPGEGLSESVSHEALVQFVVRGDSSAGLGVDAHTEHQAVRAAFGNLLQEKLLFKNLTKEQRAIQLNVKVEPVAIASTVQWKSVWPISVSLAPLEEKALNLDFRLDQERFKTLDGTLVVKISY